MYQKQFQSFLKHRLLAGAQRRSNFCIKSYSFCTLLVWEASKLRRLPLFKFLKLIPPGNWGDNFCYLIFLFLGLVLSYSVITSRFCVLRNCSLHLDDVFPLLKSDTSLETGSCNRADEKQQKEIHLQVGATKTEKRGYNTQDSRVIAHLSTN